MLHYKQGRIQGGLGVMVPSQMATIPIANTSVKKLFIWKRQLCPFPKSCSESTPGGKT